MIAYLSIRWIGATRRTDLLLVGGNWLVRTVNFEVGFGRFVIGITWERIAADYNLLEGRPMPVGLTFCSLARCLPQSCETANFALIDQQPHVRVTPSGKTQSYFFGVFR